MVGYTSMMRPPFDGCFALLAQQQGLLAQLQGAPGGIMQFLVQMGPALLIILLLYTFMIAKPQQREQKKREEQLKAIKKNDRVITSGGIFGVVTSVQTDKNEVTLRIDDKTDTKMRMQLSSIARVLVSDESSESSSDKPA